MVSSNQKQSFLMGCSSLLLVLVLLCVIPSSTNALVVAGSRNSRVRGVRILQETDAGKADPVPKASKKCSKSDKYEDLCEDTVVEAALGSEETGDDDEMVAAPDDDSPDKTSEKGTVDEAEDNGEDAANDEEAATDGSAGDIVEEAIEGPAENGAEGDDAEEGDIVPGDNEEESDLDITADANATTAVGAYLIALEPFSIGIDYGEPIYEDPGIQTYLFEEMLAEFSNLYKIELEMSVGSTEEEAKAAASSNNGQRRYLAQQYLYYTGTSYFKGPPLHEEQTVLELQSSILSDTAAVEAVIKSNLGITSSNTGAGGDLTVSSVVTDDQQASTTGTGNTENENDGLSTTGLAIVIVAAVVGGLALFIICCGEFMTKRRASAQGTVHNYVLDAKHSPDHEDDNRTKDDSPTVDLNQTYEEHA